MSGDYKYEVAFSFLARDEQLANQLNDELRDRLSTFLYSERQKELAGTDGEETFARVFGSEARVVVILYRAGWGDERWTRVESDAIRNRAHEDGYDFTLWVMLDKSSSLPKWMPKRQLWWNLERFGVSGAVNAIEMRVQEAGGDTRPLTFEEKAARLARDVQEDAARKAFLNSGDGLAAAHDEVDALQDELAQRVEVAKSTGFKATFRTKDRMTSITCSNLGLSVVWKPRFWGRTEGAQLEVAVWNGRPDIFPGQVWIDERPTRRVTRVFRFDRDHGEVGWRERHDSKFLRTSQLADECMTLLLQAVSDDQKRSER